MLLKAFEVVQHGAGKIFCLPVSPLSHSYPLRYFCRGINNSKFADPSSALTFLKKSQSMQESNLAANSPTGSPSSQKVPAIAQQILPPFFPKFKPSSLASFDAGHTPRSAVFTPSGSRPHSLYSQQFSLGLIRLGLCCAIFLSPFLIKPILESLLIPFFVFMRTLITGILITYSF
jgi:hypothetical protein